jgi:hypothetical protein
MLLGYKLVPEQLPTTIGLDVVDLVMIDGHQMLVGFAIAQIAKDNNIPIVIDGGSWKPGFEEILPFVDYAICSANFYPPGCTTCEEVIAYLAAMGFLTLPSPKAKNQSNTLAMVYQVNCQSPRLMPLIRWGRVTSSTVLSVTTS